MRAWMIVAVLLQAGMLAAQVRINELKCTRTPGSDGQGPAGDWVELYNAGSQAVDLGGYILAMDGRTERLAQGLRIMPGGTKVLWCGSPAGAAGRISMKLPRTGGSLLLIAPDGFTLLDLFTWPEIPQGASIGRRLDGGREWGFFAEPTPGAPNRGALSILLPPPTIRQGGDGLELVAAPGAEVHYTTDGTPPDERSMPGTAPLRLPAGTVVRARSFGQDAVPGPQTVFTTGLADSAWALTVAADDLLGPTGIADEIYGNHAREGRVWQRQAWVQQGGRVRPVGVAIAGSGSRGLPKRNFKLLVRDRFGGTGPVQLPDGTAWQTVLLRADATPHAFLRNTFMAEVARRSGGRVDVQPASAVPLYLNGRYHGLYRAMPAKGREWMERLNGGHEVEVAKSTGRAPMPLQQSPGFPQGIKPPAAGVQPLDTSSLVDLACFDLWTGRADHDLNVRTWRSAQAGGKWRWVMYDMDQWAPPGDRTVQRMCSSAVPETPFLPQLLADQDWQQAFLARFAALCATTLSRRQATALADSLYARHRTAMQLDHARWKGQMASPSPEECYGALLRHIAQRNDELFTQLSARTGRKRVTVSVRVEPAGAGTVAVEDLPLADASTEVLSWSGVPLHLEARAASGMEFDGWRGMAGEHGRNLLAAPTGDLRLVAVFRPQGLSGKGRLQQGFE